MPATNPERPPPFEANALVRVKPGCTELTVTPRSASRRE